MEGVNQEIRSVPWLDDYFDIAERYIRTKNRKVGYVFCGLRYDLYSIKSIARIQVASPLSAALQGSATARRDIAMFVPFPVALVCGSATSRPYAEI